MCGLILLAGCKTSEDAQAAASQMIATAQAPVEYYQAQDRILAETDQVHLVNQQLYGKPYPDTSRTQLQETEKELRIRESMARDLQALAATFGQLTGSMAAKDAADSAAALERRSGCDGRSQSLDRRAESSQVHSARQG